MRRLERPRQLRVVPIRCPSRSPQFQYPAIPELLEALDRLKKARKANPANIGSWRWYAEIEDQHDLELILMLRRVTLSNWPV